MSKIIKTTTAEASFVLNEEYPDENKAIEGKDPENSNVNVTDLKIENIKYKLKKVLINE